jgi:UDP-2-acetamido-2-deoxy-ribo-hexuluronate aminotransferase
MLNNSKPSHDQSKIKLFQSDRVWSVIRQQVFDLVDQAHAQGQAQNSYLTHELESVLAQRFNRAYCITTACATDALDIAVQSLAMEPNSRIAVPNYTFTATAHAIARAGNKPVAVDVMDNYCINADAIPEAKAIVSVDLFGNMCNYQSLYSKNIPVIVDAAQSLESVDLGGVASAKHGVLSCISFSPSKTISSWGSGGAILTDNADLAQRCQLLRLHGKRANKNMAIAPGLNSMMSSFECAAVLVGLEHSAQWQARRQQIAAFLISESTHTAAVDNLAQHTLSKLVFQSTDRSAVVNQLAQLNVETAVHYNLLINNEQIYRGGQDFLNSIKLQSTSFTVPNQHTLTDNEVEIIAKGLK